MSRISSTQQPPDQEGGNGGDTETKDGEPRDVANLSRWKNKKKVLQTEGCKCFINNQRQAFLSILSTHIPTRTNMGSPSASAGMDFRNLMINAEGLRL